MNQLSLLALILTISGLYTSRLMVRIASIMSEVSLKTILATALSAGLTFVLGRLQAPSTPTETSLQVLSVVLLVVCSAYILMPYFLTLLTRSRRYHIVDTMVTSLYWTEVGRASIQRLLAQAALRQGDAQRALALVHYTPDKALDQQYIGNDNSLLIAMQAFELLERWQELGRVMPPVHGDNALLAAAARIRALTKLGDMGQARAETDALEVRWRAQGQGPVGYRSLGLSKAYLHAARGDFNGVRNALQSHDIGVKELSLLAEAAEQSEQPAIAAQFYARAYSLASSDQAPRLAEHLHHLGKPVPASRTSRRANATLGLIAFLAACYGVQLLINQSIRSDAAQLDVAQSMAGFVVNVPIPEADAWWRYLSYGFIHGNLLHIALNMWVLWDIGKLYETRRYWPNVLTAFAFGTFLGAYLTAIAQAGDQLVLVGASGGVLGIAAALLADTLRKRNPSERALARGLLQWMLLIVVFSLAVPNVSLWGHLGGIVGGFLWGFIRQGLPADKRVDQIAAGIAIGIMSYALIEAGSWLVRYGGAL
ncbi:MAG: rhomboid family intramembrane serine protease [Deinococcota bacterium]